MTSSLVSFSLLKPRKAQHAGSLKRLRLTSEQDSTLCPVACLKHYLFLTSGKRSSSLNLFISLKRPHLPVSSNTIARWIKSFLNLAGIDTQIFSAHSTRSAGASNALRNGSSIDSNLKAGHWSKRSTFDRFYNRTCAEENL